MLPELFNKALMSTGLPLEILMPLLVNSRDSEMLEFQSFGDLSTRLMVVGSGGEPRAQRQLNNSTT